MKTIVVVSDSHGNRAALEKMFPLFEENDYIIHLGDTSGDGDFIRRKFPQKTYVLNGNCDAIRVGENEITLQIEDVKIFACHGDRYSVKTTLARIADKAKAEGCKVALFGHSHRATEETEGGILLFNPGTLSRYSRKSYLYLVVNRGEAVGKICRID